MDEVYDNIFSGPQTFKEIAFDSTPKKVEPIPVKPIQVMKQAALAKDLPKPTKEEKVMPPEIMVTVHEDRRSDSEEVTILFTTNGKKIQEESGSEDDDEYPDRVVAAPVAAPPSFEEVEQERLQQEQFGKEVGITYFLYSIKSI